MNFEKKTLQSGSFLLFLMLAIAAAEDIVTPDLQTIYHPDQAQILASAGATDSIVISNMTGTGEDGLVIEWPAPDLPHQFPKR